MLLFNQRNLFYLQEGLATDVAVTSIRVTLTLSEMVTGLVRSCISNILNSTLPLTD